MLQHSSQTHGFQPGKQDGLKRAGPKKTRVDETNLKTHGSNTKTLAADQKQL